MFITITENDKTLYLTEVNGLLVRSETKGNVNLSHYNPNWDENIDLVEEFCNAHSLNIDDVSVHFLVTFDTSANISYETMDDFYNEIANCC